MALRITRGALPGDTPVEYVRPPFTELSQAMAGIQKRADETQAVIDSTSIALANMDVSPEDVEIKNNIFKQYGSDVAKLTEGKRLDDPITKSQVSALTAKYAANPQWKILQHNKTIEDAKIKALAEGVNPNDIEGVGLGQSSIDSMTGQQVIKSLKIARRDDPISGETGVMNMIKGIKADTNWESVPKMNPTTGQYEYVVMSGTETVPEDQVRKVLLANKETWQNSVAGQTLWRDVGKNQEVFDKAYLELTLGQMYKEGYRDEQKPDITSLIPKSNDGGGGTIASPNTPTTTLNVGTTGASGIPLSYNQVYGVQEGDQITPQHISNSLEKINSAQTILDTQIQKAKQKGTPYEVAQLDYQKKMNQATIEAIEYQKGKLDELSSTAIKGKVAAMQQDGLLNSREFFRDMNLSEGQLNDYSDKLGDVVNEMLNKYPEIGDLDFNADNLTKERRDKLVKEGIIIKTPIQSTNQMGQSMTTGYTYSVNEDKLFNLTAEELSKKIGRTIKPENLKPSNDMFDSSLENLYQEAYDVKTEVTNEYLGKQTFDQVQMSDMTMFTENDKGGVLKTKWDIMNNKISNEFKQKDGTLFDTRMAYIKSGDKNIEDLKKYLNENKDVTVELKAVTPMSESQSSEVIPMMGDAMLVEVRDKDKNLVSEVVIQAGNEYYEVAYGKQGTNSVEQERARISHMVGASTPLQGGSGYINASTIVNGVTGYFEVVPMEDGSGYKLNMKEEKGDSWTTINSGMFSNKDAIKNYENKDGIIVYPTRAEALQEIQKRLLARHPRKDVVSSLNTIPMGK